MTEEAEDARFQKVLEQCMRTFAQAIAESGTDFAVQASHTAREQFHNAVRHLLALGSDVARLEAYVQAVGASVRNEGALGVIEFVRAELYAEVQMIARQQ